VVAIARHWGFADPAHFSKIFKASYGEPPGQYRHRSKAAGEPREAMTQAAR
jgi:AraC-like DNA-binding protein